MDDCIEGIGKHRDREDYNIDRISLEFDDNNDSVHLHQK